MTDTTNDAGKAVIASITSYQAKLLEIANANTQFAFEYAQALTAVRSPADFFSITNKYTRIRMEMFERQTRELADLAKFKE